MNWKFWRRKKNEEKMQLIKPKLMPVEIKELKNEKIIQEQDFRGFKIVSKRGSN